MSSELDKAPEESKVPWAQRYGGAVMNTFGAPRLVLERGEGSYVWDADGKKYLDLLGGIAVNTLGQCHPAFQKAIAEQAGRLGHVSNFFATRPQVLLAEKIIEITRGGAEPSGAERVFLANSGTEANEAAIKAVRRYGNMCGEEDASKRRTRILVQENAFHGRSTGALALTYKAAYREPFAPMPGGVEFIKTGDVAALEAAMGPDVAALFVEPVQGEVGVREMPPGYLKRARELCDEHGALLVFDEVQSGTGRTGKWMAHHHEDIGGGVVPDFVTLAKGLGGGIPIGAAVAMNERAATLLGPGAHGTTFGGNPLCAAVALAVVETIANQNLLENATKVGEYVKQGVADLKDPRIVEVRGRGMLLGIQLTEERAAAVNDALLERGVIANPANPSTLRLAPPLNLSEAEAQEFLDVLPAALDAAWV